VELPTVKFLPQRYECESGLTLNVRSATKDDMPALYAIMKHVMDTGYAYGLDEFPTITAFRAMIADAYVIVVEEPSSNKVK